jgi:branched-chain amino acid transport system permease protein
MLAQVLVSSVTSGAVYALIALGFVLIHKGTGVVHFGYGDQVMFGGYLVLIGQVVLGLSFWPAVFVALLLSALLGALIYGGFMWPLRNASLLARIIASLALGTVLREFVRAYMGPNAWPFPSGRREHRRGEGLRGFSCDLDPGIGACDPRRHSGRATSHAFA